MNTEIAETILSQMGGKNRLIAMIGAKIFVAHENGVSFSFPNPSKRVNHIKIILNGNDTYDITFGSVRNGEVKPVKEMNDIYAESLMDIFESETGLYLTLFARKS